MVRGKHPLFQKGEICAQNELSPAGQSLNSVALPPGQRHQLRTAWMSPPLITAGSGDPHRFSLGMAWLTHSLFLASSAS